MELELPSEMSMHPVFHVSELKPYSSSGEHPANVAQPENGLPSEETGADEDANSDSIEDAGPSL